MPHAIAHSLTSAGRNSVPATQSVPDPVALRLSDASGRWVVAAAVLGSSMAFLDATVINIALPVLGRDLSAGFDGLQLDHQWLHAHARVSHSPGRLARRSLRSAPPICGGDNLVDARLSGLDQVTAMQRDSAWDAYPGRPPGSTWLPGLGQLATRASIRS